MEELLLLKIHNGLKDGKNHYEATRGNWRISQKRFDTITLVAGINRGKVECLFKPKKWGIVEAGTDKGRKFFEGEEGPSDLLLRLQNSEEQLLKKFGTGSPVAYIDLNELKVI
ncbi:hypothetical protein HF078_05555 [Bacillus sp. RO2]|uniref:hypothetical protein n=1 Tax=Bacillus sp. RO2 TaxID=2723913 RepID=UPI00145DD52F|nr:hypothetical protein [Bacillus sp. RO2]NMH72534.1 hypothetical protein [Bacillus sp. RO2]